jgi:hypothetical protein
MNGNSAEKRGRKRYDILLLLRARATGVLFGFVNEAVIKAFVDSGAIPSNMIFVFQLTSILALAAFVHVTKYWGTLYLLGWWVGAGFMWYSGLLGILEFLFY